jgi:hypothetical protein
VKLFVFRTGFLDQLQQQPIPGDNPAAYKWQRLVVERAERANKMILRWSPQKYVWPNCGQNEQQMRCGGWHGMGKNVKCSKIFGGCNLRKGKDLRFCRDDNYESQGLDFSYAGRTDFLVTPL